MNWNTNQTWPNNQLTDKPYSNPNVSVPQSLNPLDQLSQDQLLVKWQETKDAIEVAKAAEMEMRKYIVSRAFPEKQEGVNNLALGNDYTLKATIKYNYKLDATNDVIENALNRISKIGNRGSIVAERLISWKPAFLLTEYKLLLDEQETSNEAKAILQIIKEILIITDATPTLEIREPKVKK